MNLDEEPFLWGAATSSHQVEGNTSLNDWHRWEVEGKTESGERSGIAIDHWNRFREDLRLAADLGLNSYRFSIEWSRVEPEPGRWDNAALDRYAEIISECERNHLKPMITLHHFTSPIWLADEGGFVSEACVGHFQRYSKKMAALFGGRVPLWCTINEPMVLAVGGYMGGFMPPGKNSSAELSHVCRNLLRCHVHAYDALHEIAVPRTGPWAKTPLRVGIAHNVLEFHADRIWHPLDLVFSRVFHRFYNQAWVDAVMGRPQHFGVKHIVPFAPQVREALDRVTVDFIGINYYTKAYIRHGESKGTPFSVTFARKGEETSDLDWSIHPKGLERLLVEFSKYKVPLYVTENGIADHDDSRRANYLRSHIQAVVRARESGADVRGYYYWSLLDNFEWTKGFGPRFGLIRVNYDKGLSREVNASAKELSRLIRLGG